MTESKRKINQWKVRMEEKTTYTLGVGEKGRERLEILNEICNPFTIDFLKKTGLTPGMAALDLGCGTGIVSSLLGELVGPEGSVLGIDVSPEQIKLAKNLISQKAQKNVTFKQLSVHELSQLQNEFDIIYARYILCHVTAVEQVLKHAYNLLKKGGIFVIEDLAGIDALFCYPPNEGYAAYIKVVKGQFEVQNSDPSIGLKLPYLLSRVGFKEIVCRIQQPILQTPIQKKVFRLAVKEVASAIVTSGRVMSEKELDDTQAKLESFEKDPFVFASFFRYSQIAVSK